MDPPLAADLPIGGGGSFWVLQPVLCVVKVVKKPHQAPDTCSAGSQLQTLVEANQAITEEPGIFATDETAVKAGQCGAICKRGAKLCVCRKEPMGHIHKDGTRPTQAELDAYRARNEET